MSEAPIRMTSDQATALAARIRIRIAARSHRHPFLLSKQEWEDYNQLDSDIDALCSLSGPTGAITDGCVASVQRLAERYGVHADA